MFDLHNAQEIARQRYEKALSQMTLTQETNRGVLQQRTRIELQRLVEQGIRRGISLGDLKHDMIVALRQAKSN